MLFALKKILSALLLPPVSSIVLALFGLWLARYHRRTGNTLVVLSLLSVLVLSWPPVSDALGRAGADGIAGAATCAAGAATAVPSRNVPSRPATTAVPAGTPSMATSVCPCTTARMPGVTGRCAMRPF